MDGPEQLLLGRRGGEASCVTRPLSFGDPVSTVSTGHWSAEALEDTGVAFQLMQGSPAQGDRKAPKSPPPKSCRRDVPKGHPWYWRRGEFRLTALGAEAWLGRPLPRLICCDDQSLEQVGAGPGLPSGSGWAAAHGCAGN